jgi:hypothetical protein
MPNLAGRTVNRHLEHLLGKPHVEARFAPPRHERRKRRAGTSVRRPRVVRRTVRGSPFSTLLR